MKKALCFALVIALAGTLCACSLPDLSALKPDFLGKEPVNQATETQQSTTEPVKTEPVETQPAATEPTEPIETEPVETNPPMAEIELDVYDLTLYEGESFRVEATADSDIRLQWRSSNEAVVLVNSLGVITAVSPGAANVTCYGEGAYEAACTVWVMATTEPVVTEPVTAEPPVEDDYFIFPHSSTAYLTEDEIHLTLSSMTGTPVAASFAQDAINEIYARNGYVFNRSDLNAYYLAQPWYTPDKTVDDDSFNKYENANILLLKEFT